MHLLTVMIPAFAGVFLLVFQNLTTGRLLLLFTATLHLGISLMSWTGPLGDLRTQGWFALDEIGRYFLTVTSILFFAAGLYANGYLKRQMILEQKNEAHASMGLKKTETLFLSALLFFLASLSLVAFCQQLEMLWVAIEATTLASAPLIYFHKSTHALEATWKYIMITSFGIALALLGNFLLSYSMSLNSEAGAHSLFLPQLLSKKISFDPTWLKVAFILLFVGYGTKMGLAPLHTWLPDAHSEAPALVSALLSGSALNCALLGILRAHQLCLAAGLQNFSQNLLIYFGLFSMAIAAIFIWKQRDFKRLLAYSSIEHMGIVALSVGLGGEAIYGGLFHLLHHSIAKAMLFLLAGNLLIATHTKMISETSGLIKTIPVSATLILIGFLTLSGFPPFGLFTSEILILHYTLTQGYFWVAFLFVFFLLLVFFGMAPLFQKILFGTTDRQPLERLEWAWSVWPPAILATVLLALGSYFPPFLVQTLHRMCGLLGGGLGGAGGMGG